MGGIWGTEGESFERVRGQVESVSENEYSTSEWMAAGQPVSKVASSHIICPINPSTFA